MSSKYTLFLSQENLALAKAELMAVFPSLIIENEDHDRLCVTGIIDHYPLALTKKIITEKKVLFVNNEDWSTRRTHRSGALSPKLARAMVNLTSTMLTTPIVDPFCGTGGILAEAALLGHPIIGYDLDSKAIARAAKNLASFHPVLHCRDACLIDEVVPALVTDLPYGRSTSVSSLITLYSTFLSRLISLLRGKMVVGFPHFVSGALLAKKAGFFVNGQYCWSLHGSLTKEILVLTSR